jgi:predicted enzyme related to lactoylglutathione lyase
VGRRTSYTPGTFSWVDLATSDVAAAKAFYGGLLGWMAEDAGDGSTYTTFRLGDDAVCGLTELPRDGGPPAWTSYVTVDDADAAVARAEELGGGATGRALDVGDAGRTALLRDPQGALVAVWEPRRRAGAERVNDLGCLCMNELATSDMDAAGSFYERLFGWTTEPVDTGPDGPPMVAVHNQGTLNASISAVQGGAPPHWRPYFTVESAERALARVGELGGTVLVGPVPIPDGGIGIAADPQGAVFALFEGEVDP